MLVDGSGAAAVATFVYLRKSVLRLIAAFNANPLLARLSHLALLMVSHN